MKNYVDTTKELTHVSLCAGYGGIDLGLRGAIPSLRTIAFSEIEAFAVANLVAKMENGLLDAAPIWTDLKTFPWGEFHNKVDILSGGFPCQPFSSAGKRAGDEDPRHLFPYMRDSKGNYALPGQVLQEKSRRTPSCQEAGARVETLFTAGQPAQPGERAYRLQPDGRLVLQSQTINQQVEMVERAWPSPKTSDGARADCKSERARNTPCLPSAVNILDHKPTSSKLNPRWVESLMGLPLGWTQPSAMTPELMSYDCSETA